MSGSNPTTRRSAAEWAALVQAWTRSGLSARDFAVERGLSPTTLSWWKWRLAKGRAETEAVELIPVEVIGEDVDSGEGWELRTATGHLRVHGALRGTELRVVLGAMGLRGGRS